MVLEVLSVLTKFPCLWPYFIIHSGQTYWLRPDFLPTAPISCLMVTELGEFALVRRVLSVLWERLQRDSQPPPACEDPAGSWQSAADMRGFTGTHAGALSPDCRLQPARLSQSVVFGYSCPRHSSSNGTYATSSLLLEANKPSISAPSFFFLNWLATLFQIIWASLRCLSQRSYYHTAP